MLTLFTVRLTAEHEGQEHEGQSRINFRDECFELNTDACKSTTGEDVIWGYDPNEQQEPPRK